MYFTAVGKVRILLRYICVSVFFSLLKQLQKIIDFDQNKIDYVNIHRWRYANAKLREAEKSLFDQNLNLALCGDYFISGRVENAFLSALDLHKKILK